MTAPPRIISIKVVSDMTSLGKTSIYAGVKAGTFPKPIRLGANRVGWLQSSIVAWIDAKVAESAAPTTTERKA